MGVFAGYIWVVLFPVLGVIAAVCVREVIEVLDTAQENTNGRRRFFKEETRDPFIDEYVFNLEKKAAYKAYFYALIAIMAAVALVMFYFLPGPPDWTQSSPVEASQHQLISLPGLETEGRQVIGITDLDESQGSSYIVAINDGQRIVDVEVPVHMASTDGNLSHPQGLLIIYECSLQDYWPSGLWTYGCTDMDHYRLILPQEYDLREIPRP